MNRLAKGASLLGEGNSSGDHAHVSRATPMQTKKKQMLSAKEAGLDAAREKATTKARRATPVRWMAE